MPTARTARTSLLLALLAAAASLTGCHRTFADAAQQRCVERSLERAPVALVAEALPDFKRACARGDASACSALGVIEERGLLSPARPDVARRHYEVACRAGDTRGCANFGRVLLRGLGGPTQPSEARALLERACASRDPAACGTLGWSLVSGHGLPREEPRGLELLSLACDGDHAISCLELGDTLATRESPADRAKAEELWLEACGLGASMACSRVAPRSDPRFGRVTSSFEQLRVAGP